jgi:hypothetical protein
MTRLTAEQLRAQRVDQAEVELSNGTVLVRGMTRKESHRVNQLADDTLAAEVFALAACLIDPPMTEDDVRAWQESDAGGMDSDFQRVVLEVQRLSKNAPGDGKELTKSGSRQRRRNS